MIHIAIGTKAQFIKMAPVILRLQKENIPFNLIDLGQHSLITKDLREEFKIKEPDVYLTKGENIANLSRGILWLMGVFLKGVSLDWIRRNIFFNKKGMCLIHGDTISTLLGLYLAKRSGLKTAHIEAGLRSFCWYEPFPEEVLRVIAMRFSDILFAPSRCALNNLKKMGLEKKTILLPGNTGQEATLFSLSKNADLGLDLEKFVLITVHRIENIFLKGRLEFIVNLVTKISNEFPVVFVQHPPTINQLNKFKLQEKLNKIKNLYFFKILSHAHFIHLLNRCEFVVTDGGSIQEEAFYLGKPCLLLRRYTERKEGLGENVILFGFKKDIADYFINHYLEFNREKGLKEISISNIIVNSLKGYAESF